MISFTYYPGPSALTHPRGQRRRASRETLVTWLSVPQVRERKDQLDGWTPGTFRGDYRSKVNVEEMSAIGFDADEEPRASLERLVYLLSACSTVVYSTFRHTEAAPRWRLVLWLSRPVSVEEYERTWRHMGGLLRAAGVGIGAAAKDPSRFWYRSGHAPGAPFSFATTDGPLLDVDAILSAQEQERIERRVSVDPHTVSESYVRAALERGAEAVARAPRGQRNDTLNHEAWSLLRLDVDPRAVRDVLLDAARVAGLPDDEAAKTIASAMRARGAQ